MKISTKGAVLDTNILIMLFAGDPRIPALLKQHPAIYIPVPALGELYHGAAKSSRSAENQKKVDEIASRFGVLDCTSVTARSFGQLKNELSKKGRPIPVNDLWIAALAHQHSLTVVSRDSHFKSLQSISLQFVE